jgi:hypothetical protein
MVIDKEDEPSENGDHVHVEYTFFVMKIKKKSLTEKYTLILEKNWISMKNGKENI